MSFNNVAFAIRPSKKEKELFIDIAIVTFYKLALDFFYVTIQSKIWNYMGFPLVFSWGRLFLGYIVVYITFIIIRFTKEKEKLYFFALQLEYIFMIVPFVSFYSLSGKPTKFFGLLIVMYYIQILLYFTIPLIRLKIKRITLPPLFKVKFKILVFLVFLVGIGFVLGNFNLRLEAISMHSAIIYAFRKSIKLEGIMAYLVVWVFRVIIPFFIVYCYFCFGGVKKYFFTVFFCLIQSLLFFALLRKEIILSIPLILFVLLFRKAFFRTMISFLIVGLFLSVVIYTTSGMRTMPALISRLLFVPAEVKYEHFEFFEDHSRLCYSEGVIGKIFGIRYPYDMPSGYVVSGGKSNNNTGYLAYGYSNLGVLGMVIAAIMFWVTFSLLELVLRRYEQTMVRGLLVYHILVLNDGDILTVWLTGGLWLVPFLFKFFCENTKREI